MSEEDPMSQPGSESVNRKDPDRPSASRILLVEDHTPTRGVIANLLTRSGYQVSVADCASTALKMLGAQKFDVLLSDIGLPDGSGYALVAQAKQQQPSIKGVALTGFATPQDARFSREAGFDFHLTKPVDFHELRTVLGEPGREGQTGMSGAP